MSLLFDTSPDEVPLKKKARKPVPEAVEEPQPVHLASQPVLLGIIGRCDGHFECSCGSQCHDVVDEFKGEWAIACCFCGLVERVPAIPGHIQAPPEGADFVLRGGRFDGLTLAQAVLQPRGEEYVVWAAGGHHRPAVKDACRKFLASAQTAR